MTWQQILKAKEYLLANGYDESTVANMSVSNIMSTYEHMQRYEDSLDQFMKWLEQNEHCTDECFTLVRLYNEWKKVK
jgi:hypothetical protein